MSQATTYDTWVDIDLAAIAHNITYLMSAQNNSDKLCLLMVKANAYGHDLELIGKHASALGVNQLGVATKQEAIQLRNSGVELPILITTEFSSDPSKELHKHDIAVTISSFESLRSFTECYGKHHPKFHIKLNNGLNRYGFNRDDIDTLVTELKAKNLVPVGIYSHYSHAPSDQTITQHQFDSFKQDVQHMQNSGITFEYIHASNSAAAAWLKDDFTNMVRLGLAAYGLQPSDDKSLPIKAALNWRVRLSAIRSLKAGESLGYGATWTAQHPAKVGILPIGYSDGLRRGPTRQAEVIYRGLRIPIVGTVMMNHCFVDLTSAATPPKIGEVVTIVGSDSNTQITAEEIAEQLGTINEEVATAISPTIKRIANPISIR